jgi:DNA-binding YbaB/EbfC family protein
MNINPFDILKNAQKVQEQMGSFQEKLGALSVTGFSGGGMVEIDMNGRMEVLNIRISPEAIDPEDMGILEGLIVSAFTNAIEKIKEVINREMGVLAGGLGLPGTFPGIGAGQS